MSESDVSFTVTPVRRELPQNNPPPLAALPGAESDYRLVVHERALNGIRTQAGASPEREIGGVLVGRHYRSGDRYLVEVEDHVAVPSRDSGAGHFEFDDTSVRAILARLEKQPDQYVVGWYHSHVFGDPFMSSMDRDLHDLHFPEPWYVSCVTSLGGWGRSSGFWRMVRGELVDIREYSLAVATNGDPAGNQKLALNSCGMRDPLTDQPSLLSLLPQLGTAPDTALMHLLGRLATDWPADSGLSDVRFLINAAKKVAADGEAVADLEDLEQRLTRLRMLSDVLVPFCASSMLRGRISVSGTECYCYSPGANQLVRLDLLQNLTLPVRVASRPISVTHAPDGHAWVLNAKRELIRFPAVDLDTWLTGDHTFEFTTAPLPEIDGSAKQISLTQDALWVRTSSSWHRFHCSADADGLITVATDRTGPLPHSDCLLVADNGFGGPLAAPALIGNDGGVLKVWKADEQGWALAASAALPAPWNTSRIIQACISGRGWHLLFAGTEHHELCLFDLNTLELDYHVVCEPDEPGITGLCGDGTGQVFLQSEGILYRA